MENIKTASPTMLFRLPARTYSADLASLESGNGTMPYRMADTLYVTYEQFREAIGLGAAPLVSIQK